MSTTPTPATSADTAPLSDASRSYWHCLIGEQAAGDFLGLSRRTMQVFRQKGGGPHFIRISARCLRYTRASLKAWADERVRRSTSDEGPA